MIPVGNTAPATERLEVTYLIPFHLAVALDFKKTKIVLLGIQG